MKVNTCPYSLGYIQKKYSPSKIVPQKIVSQKISIKKARYCYLASFINLAN